MAKNSLGITHVSRRKRTTRGNQKIALVSTFTAGTGHREEATLAGIIGEESLFRLSPDPEEDDKAKESITYLPSGEGNHTCGEAIYLDAKMKQKHT
ncbi:hypothetical protein U0070_023268 [Myodes glareolus]|uniref:Uncharacterized protein n=1 Tax=Myodes glareolus TaxID=447135 RepID=A0AAW0ICW4_MYOGA